MSDDLADLYQEVIMDRGRRPRHANRLAAFDATARGDNPMCGDRVQVWLRRDGERIAQAGFEARGCAISIASADLMAEAIAGRTAQEARGMAASLHELARTGACTGCGPEIDTLRPLSGVARYPSRVKCATLPWQALVAALDGRDGDASD